MRSVHILQLPIVHEERPFLSRYVAKYSINAQIQERGILLNNDYRSPWVCFVELYKTVWEQNHLGWWYPIWVFGWKETLAEAKESLSDLMTMSSQNLEEKSYCEMCSLQHLAQSENWKCVRIKNKHQQGAWCMVHSYIIKMMTSLSQWAKTWEHLKAIGGSSFSATLKSCIFGYDGWTMGAGTIPGMMDTLYKPEASNHRTIGDECQYHCKLWKRFCYNEHSPP